MTFVEGQGGGGDKVDFECQINQDPHICLPQNISGEYGLHINTKLLILNHLSDASYC